MWSLIAKVMQAQTAVHVPVFGGEEAVSVEHLPPVYNRWHSLLSLTAHHNESGLLSHLRAEEVGVFDYLPDARRAGRRSLVAISVPALQYDFYLAYIS